MRRTLFSMALAALILFAVAGCGGKGTGTENRAERERDSLVNVNKQQQALLDNMTNTMSEIAACLDTIAAHERVIVSGVDENGNRLSRKGIKNRLDILAKVIQEQKAKLGGLEEKFKNNAAQIQQLHSIITFLESSLSQKDAEVEKLRAEVNSKNFSVAALEQRVTLMNDTITQERATNVAQRQQIAQQDARINEVYYIVATEKELISMGIVKKEGKIIKKKKVDFSNINRSLLTKGDIRNLKVISIKGKSPKILGDVPKGSYTLDKNSNDSYTLRITNSSTFWSSNNRILVIQVKN